MTDKFNKGGSFKNRYLIRGTLTAKSPLHIGSGADTTRDGMVDDKDEYLKISAVVVDAENRPYIPGSSLRGALRCWLSESFKEEDREHGALDKVLKDLKSSEIAGETTRMERLFGSTYAEGKAEVWDAQCLSRPTTLTNARLSGWHKERVTYVAKSVAINPETGTAYDKKLYNFELVPEGAKFSFTITAQNLSNEEAGLLIIAVEGFNDKENPIVLGSMTKRGFGLFSCALDGIWRLDKTNIDTWKKHILNDNLAGYDSIRRSNYKLQANDIAGLKGLIKKPNDVALPLTKTWIMTTVTPLVIRSGGSFKWKNSERGKTRNVDMSMNWSEEATDGDGHKVADLYFSVKLEGDEAKPYYHVPSSSIRGALREWAITHLLPSHWWNIEEGLKKHVKGEEDYKDLPKHLTNLLLLFGFTVSTGDEKLDKEYNKAGRLTVKTEPFNETALRPYVDGENWKANNNDYGPAYAKRHVKPRNPLDRITNAAKKGGLHNFLEFSKGQTFKTAIIVKNATDFDNDLIEWWEKEINKGMLRFGALSSIGRGRVSVKEVKDEKNKQ